MHPGPYPKIEHSEEEIANEVTKSRRPSLEVDVFAENFESQKQFIESPTKYLPTTKRIPGTNQLEEPHWLKRTEWLYCKLWNCFTILGLFTSIPFYSIFLFYGAIGLFMAGAILILEGVYISSEVKHIIGNSRFADEYLMYTAGALNGFAALFLFIGIHYEKLIYVMIKQVLLFCSTLVILATLLSVVIDDANIEDKASTEIEGYIDTYNREYEDKIHPSLEALQTELFCCGFDKGPEDYKSDELPISCCYPKELRSSKESDELDTFKCSKSNTTSDIMNRVSTQICREKMHIFLSEFFLQTCLEPFKDFYVIVVDTEKMILITMLILNTLFLVCGFVYLIISYHHVQIKEDKYNFLEIERGLKYPADIMPLKDEEDEDQDMKKYILEYRKDLLRKKEAQKRLRSRVLVGLPGKGTKKKLIFNLTTKLHHPQPSSSDASASKDEFKEIFKAKETLKQEKATAQSKLPRSESLTNLRKTLRKVSRKDLPLEKGPRKDIGDTGTDDEMIVTRFSYNPSTQSIRKLDMDKNYDGDESSTD